MAARDHQPTTYVPGKVSVVGAYYNRARFVKSAVESLLAQDYQNFEIVLIDDGSSDSTLEELQSFDDARLRIVTQENIGFVRSLRRAIEMTNGEFISVHGSGDLSELTLLSRQVESLQDRPEVGLVGTWLLLDDEEGGKPPAVKQVQLAGRAPMELLRGAKISHGGAMYRRSLYDAVGGYRTWFVYAQDHDLWLRMTERAEVAVVPEPLYHRRKLPGGVSTSPEKRAWQIFLSEFAVFCAKERRHSGLDPLERFGEVAALMMPRSRRLGNHYASMSLGALADGERRGARAMAVASLKNAPSPRQRIAVLAVLAAVRSKWSFRALRSVHHRVRRTG